MSFQRNFPWASCRLSFNFDRPVTDVRTWDHQMTEARTRQWARRGAGGL